MFGQYKAWLEQSKQYSQQTVLSAVIGTRTFLRWAAAAGFVVSPPKAPKVVVAANDGTPLFEEDILATVAAADCPVDLLLMVLWETGLRFQEAASLRRCDIVVDGKSASVRVVERGTFVPKTPSSQRDVPVSAKLAKRLLDLPPGAGEVLFPCQEVHVYHYWLHRLRKAQVAAGVPKFSFHDLRRAVGDRLRRAGLPVDVYCRYMGHSALTGLRHYSVVTTDDLRKAHEKALAAVRRRDD